MAARSQEVFVGRAKQDSGIGSAGSLLSSRGVSLSETEYLEQISLLKGGIIV